MSGSPPRTRPAAKAFGFPEVVSFAVVELLHSSLSSSKLDLRKHWWRWAALPLWIKTRQPTSKTRRQKRSVVTCSQGWAMRDDGRQPTVNRQPPILLHVVRVGSAFSGSHFFGIFRPLAWATASSTWSDFLSQACLPKQNRACPSGAGPPEIVSRSGLEDDLQRQLHVERLAGAYPGAPFVVSNGIRRHAQAAARQARAVTQRGGS